MSSFSHLSATSHNSNNGNPKKHWRGPAWCDSAIWEAAHRFAGITHRRIRRRLFDSLSLAAANVALPTQREPRLFPGNLRRFRRGKRALTPNIGSYVLPASTHSFGRSSRTPGTPRRLDCACKKLSGEPVGEYWSAPRATESWPAGQHRGSTSAIRTALNALVAN
jgi:hypothetical protein